MLTNTDGAIKNGQSKETGNKTKKQKTKKTQHTMCWTQLHANTHKQRKYTGAIIQTTVISVREID
jgi:hypothetical protein